MESAEEATQALLSSWEMPADVIGKFRDNGITVEVFKDLNELYLKELCPHLGHRLKLRNKIHEYVDSLIDHHSEVSSDIETSNPRNDIEVKEDSLPNLSFDIESLLNKEYRPRLPDFDLKTLLETSAHGNSILCYYKEHKTLNSKKRNTLVDIIIKHIYKFVADNNLMTAEYNVIADRITALFPSESVCSYYMQAIPTRKSTSGKYVPARGKLVDKVRNLLYISEKKRRSTKAKDNKENSAETEEIQGTSDDALWLMNNDKPWDELLEKWENTYVERQNLKTSTVYEYIEKFPVLKSSKAQMLISWDFEQKYRKESLNFHKNWHSFFDKLLQLKRNEITNENALALIESLNWVTDNDQKIPIQITLMGYLVPPKGRLSKKHKVSTAEAVEGLIVQTHNTGDIEDIVKKQVEKAKSRNTTVQPYVLLLGNLHKYNTLYIVIDEVTYQMQTAARAFDLLFKIYMVFNAKYPVASSHLYLIIQKKIFGITTE